MVTIYLRHLIRLNNINSPNPTNLNKTHTGSFRDQMSAVRIQSLANFNMEHLFTVNCDEMTKIKKKRPDGPFLIKHTRRLVRISAAIHFLKWRRTSGHRRVPKNKQEHYNDSEKRNNGKSRNELFAFKLQ